MTSYVTGRCFCGDIRFRADGPFESNALCHCEDCRRSSGAPLLAWFEVRRDRLQWTRGCATAFHHKSDWPTPVTRRFCGRCGTSLTYERDGSEFLDVTIASLDDPDALRPEYHAYVSRQLAWLLFGDGLPRYERNRPESR